MDFEIVTNWQSVILILLPILGMEFNLTCFIFVERDFDSPFFESTAIYKEKFIIFSSIIFETTLHRISFVIHLSFTMNRLSG